MRNVKFLVLFLSVFSFAFAQNPDWINFTKGNHVRTVAVEGNYIWVGTNGGLVRLDKTTGSMTFYNRASGLPDNDVLAIAIDGQGNKWIGTWEGLAKFDGENWTVYNKSNSGLLDNRVLAIAIDGQGNKWIGTGLGLAVYHEGGVILDVEKYTDEIPSGFALSQNYPNPFNPTTEIRFSLPQHSYVTLKVFDILGREIATLVNEFKEAGNYSVEFSADKYQLSSGVYFYTMKAGKNFAVKKMMFIK